MYGSYDYEWYQKARKRAHPVRTAPTLLQRATDNVLSQTTAI
jgi:hypothetical protein